jgi:formamidopyrimidine-DNA glycosylase
MLLTPAAFPSRKIIGQEIVKISRLGKYLLVHLKNQYILLIHLGMTGQLLWSPATEPLSGHTHAVIAFRAERHQLRFRDIRQFGRLGLFPSREIHTHPRLKKLGPDPLKITPETFCRRIGGKSGRIKPLLLNQEVISGLGNIYADESLFEAGISPLTPAKDLGIQEFKRLFRAIRRVLKSALQAGGSSTHNYVKISGDRGGFQKAHQVYGKKGSPCPRCGEALRRILLAGRGTTFCPACQDYEPD